MLIISAQLLDEAAIEANDITCDVVDYASITAAEIQGEETFEGCNQLPAYSIALRPAEDMVIPIFVCNLHYNALKLSLKEGVAADEDMLE